MTGAHITQHSLVDIQKNEDYALARNPRQSPEPGWKHRLDPQRQKIRSRCDPSHRLSCRIEAHP